MRRITASAVMLVSLLSGCALYNEVSVTPLVLQPANIERGSDLSSMVRKADFLRAMELAPSVEARSRPLASDLAILGGAFLAAGRYDEARRHLRAALDLQPFRTTYAQTAWDLSQVEYLANNMEPSLEWALIAQEHGLGIRQWHIDYLRSLRTVALYRQQGESSDTLPVRFGRPDVPRVTVRANGVRDTEAVIDSGAVLSIISDRLATALQVRRLGDFEGTFNGLLGEPIQVRFGLLERLELGRIALENVPVAIMPDEKMRFVTGKGEHQEFHIDFLLGSNLLKEFRLELDFERQSATFTRVGARVPHPDQNLFFAGFRPHVRGAVNRKGWHLFVLDTGSEITFLNQARIASLPVQTFGSGAHSATLQGLGGAMKRGAKIENVEIGVDEWAGLFKTLPMYWSDEQESSVGIVGQNLLKHFRVVIDFGTMRLDLSRR